MNEDLKNSKQNISIESIAERIEALRAIMRQNGLYGYIIPMGDPHLNEYVPECWQRLQWLSNFTGSAGTLLIDQEGCWLWTDSRYFVQAGNELPSEHITLMKSGIAGVDTLEQWCHKKYTCHCIGVDSRTLSSALGEQLIKSFGSGRAELVLANENLVDQIWINRPPLATSLVSILPLEYSGESCTSKLQRISQELLIVNSLEKNTVNKTIVDKHLIVTTLDSIAWLLNLRAQDIPYNPVFLAYAIITISESSGTRVRLFVDQSRFAPDVGPYLELNGVELSEYDAFYVELQGCSGVVSYDPVTTNYAIVSLLKSESQQSVVCRQLFLNEGNPIPLLKSQKNSVEREGMRSCHQRDGFAVSRMLHWLFRQTRTDHFAAGLKAHVDELLVDQMLCELRMYDPLFMSPSFPSIVGFGAHGAIVHYRATLESTIPIDATAMVLIDSGGQYRDGTTDITRTVHFGMPNARECELYTRVLKGHIALSRMIFPDRTDGAMIDAFARSSLWEIGKDYGHGTGHGVGCFLNVHEFPPSIAPKYRKAPLMEGMVVSNEPGYYEDGKFGIRIENLVLVVKAECSDQASFLKFETLTKVPYCRELIDLALLTLEERRFINEYHQEVFRVHIKRAAELPSPERQQFQEWLYQVCASL